MMMLDYKGRSGGRGQESGKKGKKWLHNKWMLYVTGKLLSN